MPEATAKDAARSAESLGADKAEAAAAAKELSPSPTKEETKAEAAPAEAPQEGAPNDDKDAVASRLNLDGSDGPFMELDAHRSGNASHEVMHESSKAHSSSRPFFEADGRAGSARKS